jgi:hypothetical protein
LAITTGLLAAVWMVAKTLMFLVEASSPAA